MFEMRVRHEGHTRRFEVREQAGMWEVSTEEDSHVVRKVQYNDWHRVERAMMSIKLEVSALEEQGWVAD